MQLWTFIFWMQATSSCLISLSNNLKEKSLWHECPVTHWLTYWNEYWGFCVTTTRWECQLSKITSQPYSVWDQKHFIKIGFSSHSWALWLLTLSTAECWRTVPRSGSQHYKTLDSQACRSLEGEVGYFYCIHGNNLWFSCFSSLLKNCRFFTCVLQ